MTQKLTTKIGKIETNFITAQVTQKYSGSHQAHVVLFITAQVTQKIKA